MSGKQNGLRRNMGVRTRKDPAEKTRLTYSRPEGSTEPIAKTAASSAGEAQRTMAPKRWEERRNER